MPRKLLISAISVSLMVHVLILAAFALIRYGLIDKEPILLETVFSEERQQEEFSQELDLNTEISENLNPVAGGVVTGAVGATTGPTVSQTRIETSESLKEPELVANIREFSLPGESLLGEDLGESAVMGETGAVVEGYGAALSRLTRELLRMMRESKVMVVWLFDESESMKDDQREIRDQFHKVYEELGIAAKKDETLKNRSRGNRPQDEILLTSIVGFGEKLHVLQETPTADIELIKKAIDKIAIDESGLENMSRAVRDVVSRYRTMAARQDRRLVLVIVSDESGDDGQFIEEAINEVKRANAPVYILGREAVFGYPYARMTYVDKVYGLTHWLQVNRGPETAEVEALQWNGFGRRYDVFQSGFGPYEQVRLAKESGGIYFLLPGEEETLTGPGAWDRRKFDFLDMKEYQPDLVARREYEEQRARSPQFRQKIWDVIVRLNPYQDSLLDVREWHYSMDPQEFQQQGKENFDRALRAMGLANQAALILEQIKPQREREESWRWRAAYDLIHAQVLAYRVRLFQYLLALDQHAKQNPRPKDANSNEWIIRVRREMLPPDPEQVKITKVDLEELENQRKTAEELFRYVIDQHPGTPWSERAQGELDAGFGVQFNDRFWDPRYYASDLKLPKL
jgi:hypothetical protein